jgi:hypothetical protein
MARRAVQYESLSVIYGGSMLLWLTGGLTLRRVYGALQNGTQTG